MLRVCIAFHPIMVGNELHGKQNSFDDDRHPSPVAISRFEETYEDYVFQLSKFVEHIKCKGSIELVLYKK